MTTNERRAVDNLKAEIDKERLRAECPCIRPLLVILSKGLDAIAQADDQQPRLAA